MEIIVNRAVFVIEYRIPSSDEWRAIFGRSWNNLVWAETFLAKVQNAAPKYEWRLTSVIEADFNDEFAKTIGA
jgi:hypothetical protein